MRRGPLLRSVVLLLNGFFCRNQRVLFVPDEQNDVDDVEDGAEESTDKADLVREHDTAAEEKGRCQCPDPFCNGEQDGLSAGPTL